ncbi:MAG: septal ring lytic transglycosylase RlpA family protein [Desulfobacteraceae bacterium]|nr:septal ring lytic transglycosylase RlpA family protein [Desulfobacteraceae bacterium]
MILKSKEKLFGLCICLAVCCFAFSGCSSSNNKKIQTKPHANPLAHIKHTKKRPAKRTTSANYKTYPRPYKVFGKWYYPLPHAKDFRQRGIASWYGEEFHGRPTSNGEIFDMYQISAAHKILPLGTVVRVHNLLSNKSLVMRINDRGPFVPGRVIDLSRAAAMELGIFGPGTAPVEVIALGIGPRVASNSKAVPKYVPVDFTKGNFKIQVGAFLDRTNAEKLVGELDQSFRHTEIKPYYSRRGGKLLHRVLVGKCTTLAQAEQYQSILKQKGFNDAFAVAD